MSKPALGKGLGALIRKPAAQTQPSPPAPAAVVPDGERIERVPLSRVIASPLQPRRVFHSEQLEELKSSIAEHGIIQPLIVREVAGKLELIAGERRFRASTLLGLAEVPVIVRQATDRDVLEMALIENLQRENLNPIEEAEGFDRLRREFQLTQEEVAVKVGKNRATVANAIRLLDLDEICRDLLAQGAITTGHAKALLAVKDTTARQELAAIVVAKSLTVRETERRAALANKPPEPTKPKPDSVDNPHLDALASRLRGHLATHVRLHGSATGKGRIEIEYYNDEDLNRILDLIGLAEESV